MYPTFSYFKIAQFVAAAFTLLVNVKLYAGHSIGNGGTGIECSAQFGSKLQVLDFYDAIRNERSRSFVLDTASSSMSESMDVLLMPFKKFDEGRYLLYRNWFESFFQESQFLDDSEIPFAGDVGPKLYPDDCRFVPIIFQLSKPGIGRARYLIARERWNRLDIANKAVLVMHELLFRDALRRGQTNSMSVRRFISDYLLVMRPEDTQLEYDEALSSCFLNEYQLKLRRTKSWIYVRAFDQTKLSLTDAIDFCHNLPKNTSLLNLTDDQLLKLNEKSDLTALLESISVSKIWSLDSRPEVNSVLLSENRSIFSDPITEKLPVVCILLDDFQTRF